MSDDTRQIGRHVFIFSKPDQIGSDGSPTIVAKPVDNTQDLPREFVRYLRALFDILDQNGCGLVKLSDIQARWSASGSPNGLTGAVIESLQKVSPQNGLLSFERLCSGFKLALKAQPERTINGKGAATKMTKRSRSMPQLDALHKDWTSDSSEDSFQNYDSKRNGEIMAKLRSWRSTNVGGRNDGGNSSTGSNSPSSDRSSPTRATSTKVYFIGNEAAARKRTNDVMVNATPKVAGAMRRYSTRTNGLIAQPVSKINGIVAHAYGTNGVTNFDKEKRLQELTEENNMLHSGLEVVEKTRKWYFKRITAVQEEKLHLKESEQYTSEQLQYEVLLHKTRRKELGLDEDSFTHQKSHIEEMSRCLTRLTTGKDAAKDSAVAASSSNKKVMDEMQALRKELAEKNTRISQLEREKSELIRDLFHGKAANPVRRVPSVIKNSKIL